MVIKEMACSCLCYDVWARLSQRLINRLDIYSYIFIASTFNTLSKTFTFDYRLLNKKIGRFAPTITTELQSIEPQKPEPIRPR